PATVPRKKLMFLRIVRDPFCSLLAGNDSEQIGGRPRLGQNTTAFWSDQGRFLPGHYGPGRICKGFPAYRDQNLLVFQAGTARFDRHGSDIGNIYVPTMAPETQLRALAARCARAVENSP